jgi:ESS family glutamate:Na+ symporter
MDYRFERAIALFGQNTGVIITGILLLRICDPDMKTPVIGDFSISYALVTMFLYAMLLPVIRLLPDAVTIFFLTAAVAVVAILGASIHARLIRSKPVL